MKNISLFDLDHTLFTVNCSFLFGQYLYKKKLFSSFVMLKITSSYFLHKLGFLTLQQLHKNIFKEIFYGRKLISITQHIKPFIHQNLKKLQYDPAIKKLKKAKKHHHFVVILSNSPDFLVGPIADFLGVDDWKATTYEIEAQGTFSKISNFIEAKEKADYLKSEAHRFNIAKENVIAYSDSYLDLSFLKEAGKPIAVNPDRKLRKYSIKNNWEII